MHATLLLTLACLPASTLASLTASIHASLTASGLASVLASVFASRNARVIRSEPGEHRRPNPGEVAAGRRLAGADVTADSRLPARAGGSGGAGRVGDPAGAHRGSPQHSARTALNVPLAGGLPRSPSLTITGPAGVGDKAREIRNSLWNRKARLAQPCGPLPVTRLG